MLKKWICAVASLAALVSLAVAVSTASSQTVAGVEFTNWTDVSSNTATGTVLGHSITLAPDPTGQVNPPPASVINGSSDIFNEAYFSPPLPTSDAVNFVATTGSDSYRLQFGAPVANPILHLDSLASTLDFAGAPQITKLSGESTFTVSGSSVSGVPDNANDDSSGTVQLNGSFSSISFTATYPPGTEGIYLQVGARPPTPSNPPPPPAPPRPYIKAMHRVNLPTPAATAYPTVLNAQIGGSYTRLVWDLTSDGTPDIVAGADQTSIRFRPQSENQYVTVYAVGPGGRSQAETQRIHSFPPILPAAAEKIESKVRRLDSVLTVGPGRLLTSTPAGFQVACSLYGQAVTTQSGALQVKGCMRPISSLSDIPAKERGIVNALADQTWDFPICTGCPPDQRNIDYKPLGYGLDLTEGYVASGDVTVNGVTLHPDNGASVVVFPGADLIASSDARLEAGGLALKNRTNFQIDARPSHGVIPLGVFDRLKDPRGGLGGFGLEGQVPVDLIPGGVSKPFEGLVKPNVQLPDWLTQFGKVFPVNVDVRVANGRLVLNGLRVGPVSADLGAVGVRDFRIDYAAEPDEWRGQGSLCALGTCRLTMDPAHGGGVVVQRGQLKKAGADLDLNPGITLFPGIDLTHLRFGIELDPTVIMGGGTLRALGLFEVLGDAFAAFPSSRAPWHPSGLSNFPPEFSNRSHSETTVGVGGNMGIATPIGSIPLSSGYAYYEYPNRVGFGGGVHYDLFDVLRFDGGFGGNIVPPRFRLGGHVHTCIDLGITDVCGTVDGVISSHGFGACVGGTGGGYVYGDDLPTLWLIDGCKWSEFDEKSIRSRPRAAAAGSAVYTVNVHRGDPSRMVRIAGVGDAPRIRVTGPGGQTLDSTPGPGIARRGALRIGRTDRRWHSAFIGLQNARPGSYGVELLPGSAAVKGIAVADSQPNAKVRASVRGRGLHRVLRYSVRRRSDQRVTFVDRSASGAEHVIGTVTGGKGRIRFRATPGRGKRRIVAQFDLADLPAETRTVATYRPVSPKLGKLRKLRVRRKHTRLRVSWKRVRGAMRYEVIAVTSRGKVRLKRTRKHRITLKRIPRTVSGRVSVRAVAKLRAGKPATRRFRRTARPKTRFKKLARCKRKRTHLTCRR